MRARIKHVDPYGYLGRERHPRKEHEGREVVITELQIEIMDKDGAFVGHGDQYANDEVVRALWAKPEEGFDLVHCYVGVLDDGEVLDLIEHELEML